MRVAAHLPILGSQLCKVEVGIGVGLRRLAPKPIGVEKGLPGHIGGRVFPLSDLNQCVGLAVIDGEKCRVGVGEVQQGHVAEGLESQQAVRRERVR
jgi:hypothetical protein